MVPPTAFKLGTSGNPTLDQHVTYGYAADGRLNAIGAGGQSFAYGYVANSHLIGTITNSGASHTDTRVYAATRDWVNSRETTRSSTVKAKFAYTHDNLGRVTQNDRTGEMFSRYGNGSQGLKSSYGYNTRNELTSEITYLGGTSTVLTGRNDAYTYDQLGNRKTTTHNGDGATYTVNALNQYSERTAPRVFDVAGAAGSGATVTVTSPVPPAAASQPAVTRHGEYFFQGRQFTPTSAIYSTLTVSDGSTNVDVDAFVTATPEPFTYDADGNLMSDGRWTYTFDAENTYTYDAENRLTWMETGSAAVSAGHPRVGVYSLYDYLGRRVRKIDYTHNGSAWVLHDDRRFIYQGWNQVAEFWGTYAGGAFVSTYSRQITWGLDLSGTLTGAGGVGGLLMVQEGEQSYLPAYDALGNIHAMIKASDGSIAAAYEYDAYGKTLRESGPYAEANPFRFSTKYTDIETGLIYHDTRFYSPSLGRFVTRDTIGEQGGINLYAYVRNGVPNAWDYLGMSAADHAIRDGGSGGDTWDPSYWTNKAAAEARANSRFEQFINSASTRRAQIALQRRNRARINAENAARELDRARNVTDQKSHTGISAGVEVEHNQESFAYSWHGPLSFHGYIDDAVTPEPAEPAAGYWDGREVALAVAQGAVFDRDRENARLVDDWTAIQTAAQDTFGNAVFQQPLRTLATAGVQVTALVGTPYIGITKGPAIVSGTATVARTLGNAATQASARGYQYAMANPYRIFETGNYAIGFLQNDGTLPPPTPMGFLGNLTRSMVDNYPPEP